MDVICQAKSGMGKTAVFVLPTLQQIEPVSGQVAALVLCHTRELAYQIYHEFERFTTYLPDIKVVVFYGGVSIKNHKASLKNECPHIIVGTPGRILALARDNDLVLKNVRHFILDVCDKMLESLDMRRDVQEIFKMTPHDKQVMMFSATLSKEIRPVCKKFMQDELNGRNIRVCYANERTGGGGGFHGGYGGSGGYRGSRGPRGFGGVLANNDGFKGHRSGA